MVLIDSYCSLTSCLFPRQMWIWNLKRHKWTSPGLDPNCYSGEYFPWYHQHIKHFPPTHRDNNNNTLLLLTLHKTIFFAASPTYKSVWKCCCPVLSPDPKDKNHSTARNPATLVLTSSLFLTSAHHIMELFYEMPRKRGRNPRKGIVLKVCCNRIYDASLANNWLRLH